MPCSMHMPAKAGTTILTSRVFYLEPTKTSMFGHNSLIVCCMELVLVSKDRPSKELSNGILNLSRDSSQSEIETFQTRHLKQL